MGFEVQQEQLASCRPWSLAFPAFVPNAFEDLKGTLSGSSREPVSCLGQLDCFFAISHKKVFTSFAVLSVHGDAASRHKTRTALAIPTQVPRQL